MKNHIAWIAIACLVTLCAGDLTEHSYKDGEKVVLFANTVGPFQNPQETYSYFSLPYCGPKNPEEAKSEGLGEALLGYELVNSEIPINFKKDISQSPICHKKLSEREADAFKDAILKQYWYQLFLDDLPIWGMVGEKLEDASGENRYFLYTHKKFSISYNGDKVIEVNLTSENPVPVAKDAELEFTYSVSWNPTNVPFEHRFEKYLDFNFFEHQIHWFSIFNSFMMVIFLVGLVSIILMRTLRKDFARYSKEDDMEEVGDVGDESGWKQVLGDVFRAPAHLMLFSALVGTGVQLIFLVFFVIFFAIIGAYYETRGSMVSALVVGYSLTSFIGGYYTGGYYARNGGKSWTRTMLLQSFLFPGFSFGLLLGFDFIAVLYGSVSAISVGTITSLVLIYLFVAFPLSLAGTILGRNWNGVADNPCRINPVPHQIPEKKWYLHPFAHILLGGILPFGSIFIEMYFIFTSLWHYKYYYVYGFMLLVYIILIIVTVCVTIVSTYFLLNSEDYRWHWVSLLSSASTAGYVFLYAVYYFFVNTKMSGFFQTVYYFGYMSMFCFGMALLCGAIGFVGTSIFVRKIYQNIKID
jgi:transmembrane 9 superfamily protein 3